ncbi:MAG: hypothetical protein Ta2D_13050 [Rickettsiales bacterium]|nr:MAG: hypothetical protein Ta2D_13050 [Rickettsiales bacterium]
MTSIKINDPLKFDPKMKQKRRDFVKYEYRKIDGGDELDNYIDKMPEARILRLSRSVNLFETFKQEMFDLRKEILRDKYRKSSNYKEEDEFYIYSFTNENFKDLLKLDGKIFDNMITKIIQDLKNTDIEIILKGWEKELKEKEKKFSIKNDDFEKEKKDFDYQVDRLKEREEIIRKEEEKQKQTEKENRELITAREVAKNNIEHLEKEIEKLEEIMKGWTGDKEIYGEMRIKLGIMKEQLEQKQNEINNIQEQLNTKNIYIFLLIVFSIFIFIFLSFLYLSKNKEIKDIKEKNMELNEIINDNKDRLKLSYEQVLLLEQSKWQKVKNSFNLKNKKMDFELALFIFDFNRGDIFDTNIIMKKYKELMNEFHPDKNGDKEIAKIINVAKDFLIKQGVK